MAKYIIDIEDEYTKDWINDTPMCKELCMPISVPNRQRTYHVSTGFKLEPYTEPDRKAIEDEVWEFAKKVRLEDFIDSNGKLRGYLSSFDTYQEAKAKYELWKKPKDEVRVGDEVVEQDFKWKGVVVDIDDCGELTIMDRHGMSCSGYKPVHFKKTNRHFPEVEELLKKVRGSDD